MGWTGWTALGGTTGNSCSTLVTHPFLPDEKLYVFSSGLQDKKIYYRSRPKSAGWSGWAEFGGTSDVAMAPVLFANKYYFFAKGVNDDKIYVRTTTSVPGTKTWSALGGTTDRAVSAVVFDNRLYLFAVGKDDKKIYAQKKTATGAWSGWSEFGGTTDAALSTAVFKGRLYVFSKGQIDKKIYLRSRKAGGSWTAWQELGGFTNTNLSTVVFGGDLHVFSKGMDNKLYCLIQGRDNNWSPWFPVTPVSGTTDVGVAAAHFNGTVHLFAKGVIDKKLYTQALYVYPLPFRDDGKWGGGGNWDDPAEDDHGLGQRFSYDFNHPVGGDILAVRDGTVVYFENNPLNTNQNSSAPGYGTCLAVRHGDGTMSIHNHLKFNSIKVTCQQNVVKGQALALSGDTGESSTPHLHFGFGSLCNFLNDCRTGTGAIPEQIPTYFQDKNHKAWRPIYGDKLASNNG